MYNCRIIVPALLAISACIGQSAANDVPDFKTEVLPALTKAGCNSASCHGAAIGRGGFRLSLLGYDPDQDHQSIVYEYRGRRMNLAEPEKSLALLKPSRSIAHKGGMRLPRDGEAYEIIRNWIAAGAPIGEAANLDRLEISPTNYLARKTGEKVQVSVIAHFDDGSHRDVTQWAVYEPDDKETVQCSKEGLITSQRRGQARVLVRFLDAVRCVTVTTPLGDESTVLTRRTEANFIDRQINQKLDELRLANSQRTSDSAFARRIYLDLIGTLPTAAEVQVFANSANPRKREELVTRLMERPEFVDYWSYKWGDLLRIESGRLGKQGAVAYHDWVRRQVADNRPLDQMARELVMTTGDAFQNGAANFHRVPNDPLQQAEYVSRVFLGVRLQCANCHNHPLDRWSQDDYHGLAAIFANLDRRQTVKLMNRGDTIHPKTKAPATPKLPGGNYLDAGNELREPLLEWLTSPNNPYFAESAVNRIWKELMGRGLVEPVDDLRASNPATHPQLLDELSQSFVESGYDIRELIKTIVASEAYQRSSLPTGNNEADEVFYSRALVRPLSPVVMLDAVSKVTAIPERFTNHPPTVKAISLNDSRVSSEALDLLGRCSRVDICNVGSDNRASALPLTLHIINGQWLNEKIESESGQLRHLIDEGKTDSEILDELYWIAFGRGLSERERAYWSKQIRYDDDAERLAVLRDAFWAILNSTEFRCNH